MAVVFGTSNRGKPTASILSEFWVREWQR